MKELGVRSWELGVRIQKTENRIQNVGDRMQETEYLAQTCLESWGWNHCKIVAGKKKNMHKHGFKFLKMM